MFYSFDPKVDFKELQIFANYVSFNHIDYDSHGPATFPIELWKTEKKVKQKQMHPE
jgi:hypothetical protein